MSKIKNIKELIEMKEDIQKKRKEIKSIYIPSLDTEVKYKLATRAETVQCRSMEFIDIDPYIIYTHIVEPDLSDRELQKAYGMEGKQPHKIVDELFTMEEVGMLSMAIVDKKPEKLVQDIKNL